MVAVPYRAPVGRRRRVHPGVAWRLATTVTRVTMSHQLALNGASLAPAGKPEEESEAHDHDLRDDVRDEGRVVPLATQVGGVEERSAARQQKEDDEERA